MRFNSSLLLEKRSLILSQSFRIFIKYLPLILLIYIIQLSFVQINNYLNPLALLNVVISIILTVIQPWTTIFLIYLVYSNYKGERISFKELIVKTFANFEGMISTNVIFLLIIIGLMLLFVVPGIIGFIYYTFVWQVFVFEKIENKSALNKSKAEIKEQVHDILFYLVLGFIISLLASLGYVILQILHIDNIYINLLSVFVMNILNAYFVVLMTNIYLLHKGHLVSREKENKFSLASGYKV